MQLRHQRRGNNVLFFNRRCGRTNAFRRPGKIGRRGRFNDFKIAIVDDELEDFVDLRARSRSLQRTGPPDMRMIGFKLGQFGQAIQMCLQIERAQFAQIAENIERLVRLLQHLRLRPEGNRVSSHDIRGVRFNGHRREIHGNRGEIDSLEIGRRRRVVVFRSASWLILFDDMLKRRAAFAAKARGDGFAGLRHLDEVGQHVAGGQQHVDRFRRRRQAAAPDAVKQGFENMRKPDQRFEAEDAGAALDRMDRAEHRIDRVVRAGDPRESP